MTKVKRLTKKERNKERWEVYKKVHGIVYDGSKDSLEEWYKLVSKEKDYLSNRYKDYILVPDQYYTLARAQNYVCAICNQEETSKSMKGNIKSLSVDHDHVTKKVRGLLCMRCNSGLGMFLDDPELLLNASKYLLRHKN